MLNSNPLLALLGLAFLTAPLFATEVIPVGDFSDKGLQGWEQKSFHGHTRYQLIDTPQGRSVRASSQASASILYREIEVDLATTPYLNWSWKINNTLDNQGERSKQGDDYPARVYVVFKPGWLPWQTQAINYVWSSHQPSGSSWNNAYTDQAKMMALRSGDHEQGKWLMERRNVLADYQRLFPGQQPRLVGIAIMTDTDNTGQQAEAWYRKLYFSAQ